MLILEVQTGMDGLENMPRCTVAYSDFLDVHITHRSRAKQGKTGGINIDI